MASNRKLDEKKLRDNQIRQGNRGPAGRFAGLKEKPKDTKKIVSRLLQYISFSKRNLIFLIIIVLITTFCSLSTNVIIQKVVNSLGIYNFTNKTWQIEPNQADFMTYLLLLASIYLVYSLLTYFSNILSNYITIRMLKKMRKDMMNKLVLLPISYTDTHQHGDLMSRMTNDIGNIVNSVSSTLTSLISGIITIIGCLGIMLYFSPLLTAVSLATLFLSMLVTLFMSKYMRPLFVKQQKILGLLNSQTEEMVSGSKTVIAYNHQRLAQDEFNEFSNDLKKTSIKAQIIAGSMGPIMNFVGNVGHLLVCYFGATFYINGIGGTILGTPLVLATVVMFVSLNKQFTRPINELASLYSQIITALAGAERVFEVLDANTEILDGRPVLNDNMKGSIDFEHVNFSYRPEHQILKDFSLDIRGGHKIALVGKTGSGKTTLVNLLLRFYDIDSGVIKIDGIDIKDISKKELRDKISIVLQDAVLFEDTIENNIRYGNLNATDEEFENALKMANCYKFVKRLPEQEKTILTEGATNISQGQRQLLTIARAVLANPRILILDEATSSVDTRTEKKIQDAMINLMKNRTSIIIAHRLSTIQDADLIVVMDDGRVVEMGNHEELVALDGVYNKLYQTQKNGLDT